MDKRTSNSAQDADVRKGPWTMEEDLILINYIANHGEGIWNSLAKSAGLKRTGKSCRLRWLNYLRPDVRRGNITPEEQLLIMELHAKWGNRWSKIAKHLPGRTDNEIKNYWRTRIQKHIKQVEDHNQNIIHHGQTSSDHEMININYDNQANCCSTSQVSCSNSADALVVDQINCYSPPPTNNNIFNNYQHHPNNNYFQEAVYNPQTSSSNVLVPPHPDHPHQSNDTCWSMEDIWSMQLLNDD